MFIYIYIFTFVANLKEQSVSCKLAKSGDIFTNINVLLFPPISNNNYYYIIFYKYLK